MRWVKHGGGNAAGVSHQEEIVLETLRQRDNLIEHPEDPATGRAAYKTLPGLPRQMIVDYGHTHYVTDNIKARYQAEKAAAQLAAAQAAQRAAEEAAQAAREAAEAAGLEQPSQGGQHPLQA